MELVDILHMKGGDGESSYAENSVVQRKLIAMTKPVKEAAVRRLYTAGVLPKYGSAVGIADLGCSTGPNALLVTGELIAAVERICRESDDVDSGSQEFQVFLNDLPGNDFNAIFRGLPEFRRRLREEVGPAGLGFCFVNGVPGSFYGRLFPADTLHLVHSSSCLHWLSQVPKGIERSKRKSEEAVGEAYWEQFKSDFSTFLKCRAVELVTGGSLLFTLHGRKDHFPPSYQQCFASTWQFLDVALNQMLSQGLIEAEKLDTFNRPLYAPSRAEIEGEVSKEGSFVITDFISYEVGIWDIGDGFPLERKIRYLVSSMRSGIESFLISHFGEQLCVDEVFRIYEDIIRHNLTEEMTKLLMFTVSLAKIR